MYIVEEEAFLAHHGIVGMHWGVRNGPPYPLDSSISTGSRLIKKDSSGQKSGFKGLTDQQKKYIKYGAIGVGAAVAIAGGIYLAKSGYGAQALNQIMDRKSGVLDEYGFTSENLKEAARQRLTRLSSQITGKSSDSVASLKDALPKIKERVLHGPEYCVKSVNNQLRHTLESRRQNNCMLCTTAYDLRRRGYDVTAGNTPIGFSSESVLEWYDNVEVKKAYSMTGGDPVSEISQVLLKQGDGARGNFIVSWAAGGGHSMAYEIRNGQVMIMDGQIGKQVSLTEVLKRADLSSGVEYARLDTATPKLKFMIDHGLVEAKGFKNKKASNFVKDTGTIFKSIPELARLSESPSSQVAELTKKMGETRFYQYLANCQELGNDATVAAYAGAGALFVASEIQDSRELNANKQTQKR